MLYVYEATLTAGQTKLDEVITDCPLQFGRVKRIEVNFPRGCCGLVYVAIDKNNVQVIPTNCTYYLRAENETISIACDFKNHDTPFLFRFRAYNTDDFFTHTIQVRFYLEEPFDPDVINSEITQEVF